MTEKLSALVDNELDELDRARVLRDLGRQSELAALWSRYHIIGLAMRRESICPDSGLPGRVASALESETTGDGQAVSPKRRAPLVRSAGRFAVAASVVGVLVVGGLVVNLYENTRTGNTAAPSGQQVAFSSDSTRWDDVDPRVEDALNALLVEHGEFTSASGMNGLTAYTKFVAYDSR